MRLAELLHDVVSDRYIRECLEDKYKQEYRAENAKKQVKKKSAELAPLEKQVSALHVVEENNGMVLLQDPSKASSNVFETADKSSDDNISTESGSDKDRIPPVATFQAVSSGLHKKKNEEVHIFSFARNALYDYLQWIFRKHGRSQDIFFHVVIDKKIRQPITAGLGDLSKPVE
jgi:hypothetical protein